LIQPKALQTIGFTVLARADGRKISQCECGSRESRHCMIEGKNGTELDTRLSTFTDEPRFEAKP
jgi:hypothetical protein